MSSVIFAFSGGSRDGHDKGVAVYVRVPADHHQGVFLGQTGPTGGQVWFPRAAPPRVVPVR